MSQGGKLRTYTALATVACLVGLTGVASAASSGFSGKVCPMLVAKVVASVHVQAKLRQQKTVTTSIMGAQMTAI